MPIYEYRCRACGRRFELLQGVGAARSGEEPRCPHCGEKDPARVMSAPFTPKSRANDSRAEGFCCGEDKKDGCVPGECCGCWPDNDDYVKLP